MNLRSPGEILSEIESVLDEMIKFSQEKCGTLVSGDTQRLSEIVLSETELMERLSLIEKRWGLPGTETSRIHPLMEAVRSKATILKEANELNQALIRQGLRLVQYEMRFLTGQEPGYEVALPQPLVFDKRV